MKCKNLDVIRVFMFFLPHFMFCTKLRYGDFCDINEVSSIN